MYRFFVAFLFGLLLLVFSSVVGAQILENGAKMIKIGPMFSGSYINVNIAREDAIFSRAGVQYLSYFDPDGNVLIATRSAGTHEFVNTKVPVQVDRSILSDPHNYISMQIDAEGFIHLVYGHHNSRMNYIRSTLPYSVAKWDRPRNKPDHGVGGGVTYLSFFTAADRLLAMYRSGPHGRGHQVLVSYDIKSKQWRPIHTPFVSDEGRASPYFFRPAVDRDGTIHLFWTWRLDSYGAENSDNPVLKDDFSGFVNTDIYHARSADFGKTWTSSRGTVYSIPIKRNADGAQYAELVTEIPIGEDFFNHFGSAVDSEGRPFIVYTRRDDEKVAQQWLTRWDGTNWKTTQVTSYKRKINWTRQQQNGHASTDIARPSLLLTPDGRALVFSRTKEFANEIGLYVSKSPQYDQWARIRLFRGSTGGWEPQFDMSLWLDEGIISLLLLGITDKAVYEAYDIDSKPHTFVNTLRTTWRNITRLVTTLWQKATLGEVSGIDYYSDDTQVDILSVDPLLDDNTGYILELPRSSIR